MTTTIMGTAMHTDTQLFRLLQLSSVSLPVGGFAFSQGMEYAIDAGWVKNYAQTKAWLEDQLEHSVAWVDLPLLRLAKDAAEHHDLVALMTLNDLALACRETKELRLNDTAMGEALARLLRSQGVDVPFAVAEPVSFVVLFAVAAAHWNINTPDTLKGFVWAWLENQVAAATKLVPLGQTQAQTLLGELQPALCETINDSLAVDQDEVGAALPMLAIASARHETQYSRLFRS